MQTKQIAPPAPLVEELNPDLATPETNGSSNGKSRMPSRLAKRRGWTKRGKILLTLGIVLFVALCGGGASYVLIAKPFQTERTDLVKHKVRYGTLELTIVERGALESANNHDI